MEIDRTDFRYPTDATARRGVDLARLLRAAWRNLLARHSRRRLNVMLSRLEPRRLRDLGFDPHEVYGAVEGSWDEITTDRFRRLEDD